MSCELTHTVLHGYLDGELDAARAAEFERHLETCPTCLKALESQEALRTALRRAGLPETVPSRLQARVRLAIDGSAGSPRPGGSFVLRWLVPAAAVIFVFLLGYRAFLPKGPLPTLDISVQQVLDAHLRSLQPGHLTDVASTDQHTVKPWFDGRVDFAPPVRDFSDAGFPLQGGRVDVLNARTVAALVYGRHKHVVNVFVWPTSEGDAKIAQGSTRGYQWVCWRNDGMEYCAISDVNMQDLRQLVDLLAH